MSTHGYSQNQILVWKYPSLTQVAKLTGHSYRVLYLVSLPSWALFLHLEQLRALGLDCRARQHHSESASPAPLPCEQGQLRLPL